MEQERIIALAALAIGISAAGALSAWRNNEGQASVYLVAIFAVFAGLAALPLVIAFSISLYTVYMPLMLPMLMAVPPLTYHYIAALTHQVGHKRHYRRDTALPAFGGLIALGYWILPPEPRFIMLVNGDLPDGAGPAVLAFSTLVALFCWGITSFAYLVGTLPHLRAFRAKLKQVYSNTDQRELRWIDWMMGCLIAMWITAAMALLSDNLGPRTIIPIEIAFVFMIALLMILVGFAAIELPPNTDGETATPDTPAASKYTRSALSMDYGQQLARRIEHAMKEDKLYLDANLSLQKLSHHVGALPNLVSQTLNEHIGSSFFDYVAHWRIEAAKPHILEGKLSVLTVAMEVGFNSRSTFYKAFKKETGLTPKAFRDMAEEAF